MFHIDALNHQDREAHLIAYDRAAALLHDYLNFFMSAFSELTDTVYSDRKDHHLTPMLLMIGFAEAIDGVALLVKQGSAKNCGHLLRSALEAQLGLFYLWESKPDYENRCLAYQVAHVHQRLKWLERFDKQTQAGQELRASLADDPLAHWFDKVPPSPMMAARRQAHTQELQSPRLLLIEQEWQRTKKANNKKAPHWYSLWGGPKDARALAYSLKMGSTYETAYRLWSEGSHAEDALLRVRGQATGHPVFDFIRSPSGLPGVCAMASNFCLMTTSRAVQTAIAHEWLKYDNWFVTHLKGRLHEVMQDLGSLQLLGMTKGSPQ